MTEGTYKKVATEWGMRLRWCPKKDNYSGYKKIKKRRKRVKELSKLKYLRPAYVRNKTPVEQLLSDYRFKVDNLGKNEKLKLLKEYSAIYINYVDGKDLKEKRGEFIELKEYIGNKCSVCDSKSVVRHHIIAMNHGGGNERNNLTPLCGKCHEEIHDWL